MKITLPFEILQERLEEHLLRIEQVVYCGKNNWAPALGAIL